MKRTVIELFAGVGGFRVGLNKIRKIKKDGSADEHGDFEFVWANQWEPSTKIQHAFDCYNLRFSKDKDNNSNEDICKVNKEEIPDHTLLCGGFPCQDYSVAHSLSTEKGIEGKKGVLWWQIRAILEAKKTPFVLLENVDRLTKSPAKQRGRDFGIMLRCLDELGYIVEWRIINAADYGHPQRRRRTYIFAYHKSTHYAKDILTNSERDVLTDKGLFARTFPIVKNDFKITSTNLLKNFKDLPDFSDNFAFTFENSGYMANGVVYTAKTLPVTKKPISLGKIVVKEVDEHFYLNDNQAAQFKYLRGSKKIERVSATGLKYIYSEGAMSPYDDLSLPGRTMLTSEGTVNRSTHVIIDPITKRVRRLTPVECERLNQFPDDWTDSGMPEKRRYFMMGNALVCGIIEKLGDQIKLIIDNE